MTRPLAAVAAVSRRRGRWLPLLLLLMLPLAGLQAQPRIGYVEMKRLLDNAPQMGGSSERLQAEFAERDRQLRADQARLERMRQAQRDGTAAPSASGEIEALERRIQRTRDTLREDLRRRSEQEVELRFQQISEAVADYARANNYDLIVHSPVFYASPAIDITDQVLDLLRQRHDDHDNDTP